MPAFIILLFMAIIGGVCAFDIGGIASEAHERSSGATSWGRSLKERGLYPNFFRVVGWVFFIVGSLFCLLDFLAASARFFS